MGKSSIRRCYLVHYAVCIQMNFQKGDDLDEENE